jgi:Chaperone of endosialidase
MNPVIQLKSRTLVFLVALICFALSPGSKAVNPAPDGGYPGGNTAEGTDALLSLSSGTNNTAIGADALANNASGNDNTAVGFQALLLATGNHNTAVGSEALFFDTSGHDNTATGFQALLNNTTGIENVASGAFALINNQTGDFNTATGTGALQANIGGDANTATGTGALSDNTSGNNNTANGINALFFNTTGNQNTATGAAALLSNTIANNNTADGFQALNSNTGGSNTAIGSKALFHNRTGSSNIGLGVSAGANLTTGSNNIAIGNFGVAAESNTIRIGQVQTRTFIKGISGVAIAGAPVVVNAGGQLGVAPSSTDFKHEIRPMGEESEVILAFKPVSFCYDQDIDEQGLPQFGLVAEDVEKANPDLVVRDEAGQPYSVRYDQVNAMLLNEFLKEHAKVEQLKKDFESKIAKQQKQIEGLTAGLQRVSAQLAAASPSDGGLELSKFATGRIRLGGPAPQTVKNTD